MRNKKMWDNNARNVLMYLRSGGNIMILKGGENMITQQMELETKTDACDDAKARRNADYAAKLDKSFRELEEGKLFVTNIETLEAMTYE
jgi:hypothetical protein